MIPRERTLRILADILKSNGQEVPFEVPEVKSLLKSLTALPPLVSTALLLFLFHQISNFPKSVFASLKLILSANVQFVAQ